MAVAKSIFAALPILEFPFIKDFAIIKIKEDIINLTKHTPPKETKVVPLIKIIGTISGYLVSAIAPSKASPKGVAPDGSLHIPISIERIYMSMLFNSKNFLISILFSKSLSSLL